MSELASAQIPEWRRRASNTRRQRSEARILIAARRLFTETGFEASTVEMIATEAGVGPATIYNRFGAKSAILSAVIAESVAPLAAAVRDDLATRTPLRDAIAAHLVRTAKFLSEHRAVANALLYALADETHPRPDGARNKICLTPVLQEPLALLVGAGQASGALRKKPGADEVAMIATNLLILSVMSQPTAPPSRLARGIISVVLDGISLEPAADAV